MIIRFLANAVALAVATWLVPGITLSAGSMGAKVATLAVVAIIFGVLNALVKPIFEVVTGCLIVATFGLFLWVINAAMLMLTSTVAGGLGAGFHVSGWTDAFLGALVIAVVSWLTNGALRRFRHRQDDDV